MKNILLLLSVFWVLLSTISSYANSERLLSCDLLYKKDSLLAQGATGSVYSLKFFHKFAKMGEISCQRQDNCNNVIVKEVPGLKWHNIQASSLLQSKAAKLGIAPKIYEYGLCLKDEQSIAYIIQERLVPVTLRDVATSGDDFEDSIRDRLEILHENNLIHGDIHLANIMKKSDKSTEFLFTDFDKGLSVDDLDDDSAQYHKDSEYAKLIEMFEGKFYPKGGSPSDSVKQIIPYQYQPWHTQAYKNKYIDKNKDGKISNKERDAHATKIGSFTTAKLSQYLYNNAMADLQRTQAVGILVDNNNDGLLSNVELSEFINNNQNSEEIEISELIEDYEQYSSNLRKRHTTHVESDSNRIVRQDILAKNILIISGGDITSKRRFPQKTIPHMAKFARNLGYRFEHFNGSLAGKKVPYWHKIYMILDKMENNNNKVIVWFDDDGVVATNSNMVEKYLHKYQKDIIIAMDPNHHATLNTGAFIVRNTKYAKAVLVKMLQIGNESRVIDGVKRKKHLFSCKQAYTCLHEQQALQELFLGKKLVFDPMSKEFHRSKLIDRDQKIDWKKFIEVVPQIDNKDNLNMNLFAESSKSTLYGRNDPHSDNWIKYYQNGTMPFFVQCAGLVTSSKDYCINSLIKYRE